MPERHNLSLIWDPVAEHVDPGKPAHGRHFDQGILHCWISERIPLLHQVDPQQRDQRIGRTAAFAAGLGVMGLDQGDQGLPGHYLLHLRQELLPLGLLLGGRLLGVREAELLAAHHPSPCMRSQHHCLVDGLGFPGLP